MNGSPSAGFCTPNPWGSLGFRSQWPGKTVTSSEASLPHPDRIWWSTLNPGAKETSVTVVPVKKGPSQDYFYFRGWIYSQDSSNLWIEELTFSALPAPLSQRGQTAWKTFRHERLKPSVMRTLPYRVAFPGTALTADCSLGPAACTRALEIAPWFRFKFSAMVVTITHVCGLQRQYPK